MSIWGKMLSLGVSQSKISYLQYIRTNYSDFSITFSNWEYDLADTWELVYKQERTPIEFGNWPGIIGTRVGNYSKLYVQYNLWNYRTVINFAYNGTWAGDANVSFNSPFDYTNYYKIRCAAGNFSILKGSSLDDISTVAGTKIFTTASGNTGEPIVLCPLSGPYRLDNSIYGLTVWRNNEKIHEYLPIIDGFRDVATGDNYIVTTTGHINGPSRPR